MKFKINDINVLHSRISPFLKVENDYRIRILNDKLSSNDFNTILSMIGEKSFTMLLLYNLGLRKHVNQKKYQLNRYFNITNWKEHVIDNEEVSFPIRFIEVNQVTDEEIIKYYTGFMRHQVSPLMTNFLTKETLLRVSPFYLDIVSEDVKLIGQLKAQFDLLYEKEFDDAEPLSEEDLK
ncbi:hypothetical protein [Macrococcus equi]|uniref:hypothetical protein n=1 Tax=Macrococcus equi TaxID=3395462 RepID=UPI0039BEB3D9